MSPTRSEVRDLLESVGSSDVPAPRPGFVSSLENQLLADASQPLPAAPPLASRRRRLVLPLGAAAAAAVAVVVALVVALTPDSEPDRNQLATRPSVSTTFPLADPGAVDAPATPPEVTVPDARPPTTSRAVTPTTSPPTTTTTRRATTTTQPAVQSMSLRAERDLGGVHLWWSPYLGPNFDRYLCLRADSPNRPTYPEDANTRAVWSTSDQDDDYYTDPRPAAGETSYLMVAVDRSGRELARSNIVVVPALASTAAP